MINNPAIAVHTFTRHILTSFSVDEILVLRYMNLSTDFRHLLLKMEMVPSHLKHINSVLFAFTCQFLLLLALCYAVEIQLR